LCRPWYLVEGPRPPAAAVDDEVPDLDARIAAAVDLVDRLCAIAERAGLALELDADRLAEDGEQYLGPAWAGSSPARADARLGLAESVERRRRARRPTEPIVTLAAPVTFEAVP